MDAWEPCYPIYKHPVHRKAKPPRVHAHLIEAACHLIARGMMYKDVAPILSSKAASDHALCARVEAMLDADGGIARARVKYIQQKLGVMASEDGVDRTKLIQSIKDRMNRAKYDRDYFMGAQLLAKICGFDVNVNLNMTTDPLRQLSDALQERLKLVPPRPKEIPQHVRDLEEAQRRRGDIIDVTPTEN